MSVRRAARPRDAEQLRRADHAEEFRRQQEHARVWRELTASETAGALANELSQPLTAILASAQALLRTYRARPSRDPQVREAIEDVAREAFRASKIIQRMRFLVRRRQTAKHPLDVNEAIRSIAPVIRGGARQHGAVLTLDLAPALPASVGDRTHIQQVVLSLVRNAFEAMTDLPPESRKLRVRTSVAEDMITVAVEDSGPPVDDDTLALLFVPFFTSKADGVGLGLSVCRSVVEAHGGRIEAARNARRGLTVRFSVPFAD